MNKHVVYRLVIKRLLDFMVALLSLIILSPLMFIIMVLINCDSKGGALFKQQRIGKNLKIFTIYKFRTMIPNAYEIGGATSYEGDPRITKIGAFLRKTSLDELPQLINIILGQMSIIGPRPILEEEGAPFNCLSLYQKRYSVRPGLFCTVDVHYRAVATRETQFKMDADYVEEMSFLIDVKVFFKTFMAVVKRQNVYKESNAGVHTNSENIS